MDLKRKAFDVVDNFERELADYCGSKWAVAVDSCTNALFLCFRYRHPNKIALPARTYVGVAQAARNAGCTVAFEDYSWNGEYLIHPINVVDSARWLRRDMYYPGTLTCLSFHAAKHLPIGRGGAILTDDDAEVMWLKRARYDGRDQDESLDVQEIFQEGYHMYMTPEKAARGLQLLSWLPDSNSPIPGEYPDLSKKAWR